MKYLGVDFGLKRIGLAISEGNFASPFKIIESKNLADAVAKIAKISKDFDKVIVGMPEGDMGKATEKFINSLKKVGVKVETADETLSSQNAAKLMIEMGLKRKKRKENDAMAAAEILQNYLNR